MTPEDNDDQGGRSSWGRSSWGVNAKVQAAGAAGAAATLIVFIAAQFGLDIPPSAAAAIATLLSFAAGYLKPETAPPPERH